MGLCRVSSADSESDFCQSSVVSDYIFLKVAIWEECLDDLILASLNFVRRDPDLVAESRHRLLECSEGIEPLEDGRDGLNFVAIQLMAPLDELRVESAGEELSVFTLQNLFILALFLQKVARSHEFVFGRQSWVLNVL